MKKNESITKVMSKEVTTIQIGEPVSKLRQIFEQRHIHHVPVVDGENLVGIVSWTDLLRVSFGEMGNQDGRELDAILDHTYKLNDVMNSQPTTITATNTVRDAARILGQAQYHALPVVEGTQLVGIVTTTDLMNYLVDQ